MVRGFGRKVLALERHSVCDLRGLRIPPADNEIEILRVGTED